MVNIFRTVVFAVLGTVLGAALIGCRTKSDQGGDGNSSARNLFIGDPGVIVQLFEWRWDDIAQECEAFLGPAGYAAVQVSSPVENSVVEGRPWWERYQPVSYRVDTRSGNRTEFKDMVSRCNAAGVEIYVDVILNHMTGVYAGTGTAGSTFTEYDYPGIYTYDDFHHCGLTEGDDIADYEDPQQVRDCELVNLADLKTEKPSVRRQLSAYLSDFLSMGVSGFRLDAAKHMPPEDIRAILEGAGDAPYVYQEVYEMDPEPVWAPPYYASGSVTDFRYGLAVSLIFRKGSLSNLYGDGSMWDRFEPEPGDKALIFIDNHDTQRRTTENGVLTFKDGVLHDLATVFMLGFPYGRPRVMSSYAFEQSNEGPPSSDDESIKPVHTNGEVNCGRGEWVCEHRAPLVAGMAGFRRATAKDPRVTDWWSDGEDRVAFGRGSSGFLAINRSMEPMHNNLQTGLEEGSYCNVLAADSEACTDIVSVNSDGIASLSVAPLSAVAIYTGRTRQGQ